MLVQRIMPMRPTWTCAVIGGANVAKAPLLFTWRKFRGTSGPHLSQVHSLKSPAARAGTSRTIGEDYVHTNHRSIGKSRADLHRRPDTGRVSSRSAGGVPRFRVARRSARLD